MSTLDEALVEARARFAEHRPVSRRWHEDAITVMPGGNTRTVLFHAPFPLRIARGYGSRLVDVDGHEYVDMLGEYTAGLYGHSQPAIIAAVRRALDDGLSLAGHNTYEPQLARLLVDRFPAMELVRFTNSGTEANLMAISTALMATRRTRLMVFHGGYHGGVLYFASGAAPWNAPYDVVVAPYNDLPGTLALIEAHGSELAAVVMEAMLGSGGCVPADGEFVRGVAAAARAAGALFVADEVMTSRHGRRGMMDLLGVSPDITTFGKYIGGGFSFGAFGGSAEYLDLYDTSAEGGRSWAISHAGTFNNNVATMTAGGVVLGEVFDADRAEAHTERGNEFRAHVAAVLARHSAPVSVSGFGSMMSLHGLRTAPTTPVEALQRDNALNELLFLGLLERGVYIATRGMMNVGLAHTDEQLATALECLDDLLDELDELAS